MSIDEKEQVEAVKKALRQYYDYLDAGQVQQEILVSAQVLRCLLVDENGILPPRNECA